ncbi:Transcription factor IIIA [Grifola frondosa]|uniref:Transcription factor IIIA n=1 Tax=Grifola frondosa TaxID=5627 RepID=A0A1C7MPD8_GRIFR|nr:Transcription factor IIIA [Grifola frondosa]
MELLTSSATTITLRKRKNRDSEPFVLHLSSPSPSCEFDPSQSESEYEPGTISLVPSGPALVSSSKGGRRYECTFEGCTKAYTKPSRLAEHQRSHTGDRPFVCATCNKSYLRESHLQAHARTHLPSSSRPFACEEPGCSKRFWTSQHLRVHGELHKGERPFKCNEPSCDASFSKHHQLREHICTAHSPPGTKPYRCEHVGCTKSFATSQKLRAHVKIHDDKRYTCVHKACLPVQGASVTYYPTWSVLQHHVRTAHPPACPHASCNGKTFASQRGLRTHLKIHTQHDVEAELTHVLAGSAGENEDEDERPRKRRRGGEIGRDWVCEVDGCDKDFKSKKALTTHHNVSHLGRRDFVCPHSDCQRAFGYKHLLQRHLMKIHPPDSSPSSESEGNDDSDEPNDTDIDVPSKPNAMASLDIDFITGNAYATRSREQMKSANKLRCPFPDLPELLSNISRPSASGPVVACQYVFSRAYDLRRHLNAEHRLEVEKDKVDAWVKSAKGAKITL